MISDSNSLLHLFCPYQTPVGLGISLPTMTVLIDAWEKPIGYWKYRNTYELTSAGMDGQVNTYDDVLVEAFLKDNGDENVLGDGDATSEEKAAAEKRILAASRLIEKRQAESGYELRDLIIAITKSSVFATR